MAQIFLRVTAQDGDWEVIYLDGVKLCEGHSVPAWRLIDALRGKDLLDVDIQEGRELSEEQIDSVGGLFPDIASELPPYGG